jgi:NADPH:quinone reductase-like Zn-dependent oxidoreductase
MKAIYMERFGAPDVLTYGDRPDPVTAADEVLIDVAAASVNAADWKQRRGSYADLAFPHVLGRDVSGTVAAVGDTVTNFRPGDEVFAVSLQGSEGGYAEKIALKERIVGRKPASVSHVEAAAMALTGLTAVSALEETLQLQAGETILIQGGAGGVAGFAIQLAKHIGARVITTASRANHAYVRSLGADEVIDYNTADFTQVVKNCDAALDTIGGEVAERTLSVLNPGGRAAFIGGPAPTSKRPDLRALKPPVTRSTERMNRVADLIDAGAIRPPEITVYRLDQAAEAHNVSESRHFRGKRRCGPRAGAAVHSG